MCFSLFKKRYYYYKVAHCEDNKKYYIMCEDCYNLLPQYLKIQHVEPLKKTFIIKFDDNKMLIEDLVENINCNECFKLNTDLNYYENMNKMLKNQLFKRVI